MSGDSKDPSVGGGGGGDGARREDPQQETEGMQMIQMSNLSLS